MEIRYLAWFALWQMVAPLRDCIDDVPMLIVGFLLSEIVFRLVCNGHGTRR